MSGERAASRRAVFAPHYGNVQALRRCPICRWAVDQDHAEAIGLGRGSRDGDALPASAGRPQPAARIEVEPAAGFALV